MPALSRVKSSCNALHLHVPLSIYLSIYISIYLYIYMSIYIYVCIHLSISSFSEETTTFLPVLKERC